MVLCHTNIISVGLRVFVFRGATTKMSKGRLKKNHNSMGVPKFQGVI